MLHARLSPSSSSRWLSCTASVKASEAYENTTNSAAAWGTTVHGIGELLLLGKDIPDVVEGMEVDEEMMDCAIDYQQYCEAIVQDHSVVLVEERFDLSFIAPTTFGTSDFSCLTGTHLDIVDLKTGHGIVMAEDNTQLMLYALGALHELEDIYDVETVTLHIMQSRAGHVDRWDLSVEELLKFELLAQGQAQAIHAGNVTFNPTQKGCQWCPHKHDCVALMNHVENIVKADFDNLDDLEGNADKVSNASLKRILDNADLITSFVKAVKEVALERAEAGQEIEGYKVVATKPNRKWIDEERVKVLLDGEDIYVEKLKPMTKLLKEFKHVEELQELLIKPEGVPVLVPNSDKREPLAKTCDDFDTL